MLLLLIFMLWLCSATHSTVTIGQINDYVMVAAGNSSQLNLTHEECLCEMIRSSRLVFALNYFSTNQTCQLFYSNLTSVSVQPKNNSFFIFRNQSVMTITDASRSIARLPISSLAAVDASNYDAGAGTPTAQGDALVGRVNATGATYFNAGDYAPQYVQLELPGEYSIVSVCLLVAQSPSGLTEHRLSVGSTLANLTLVSTLHNVTSSGQWLNITYSPPLARVQFLRLDSISSPSWIAWGKFLVYDV